MSLLINLMPKPVIQHRYQYSIKLGTDCPKVSSAVSLVMEDILTAMEVCRKHIGPVHNTGLSTDTCGGHVSSLHMVQVKR